MDVKKLSMSMQYRPRDSGDRRMYNPERDVAYLTPILMQLTTNSFYPGGEAHGEFQQLSDEKQDTFEAMIVAISEFCKKFMRGERTFTEALADSTVSSYPKGLHDLWLSHFGHTVISAFYYGARDIMVRDNEEDPMPYDRIFDSAEELRRNLKGIQNA